MDFTIFELQEEQIYIGHSIFCDNINLKMKIMKIMEKCSQDEILRKELFERPKGFEPTTFQKYRSDVITTEVWKTRGEQGHEMTKG